MREPKSPPLGALRDRVELLSNVQTVGGAGGVSDNHVSLGFVWARVRALAGSLISLPDERSNRVLYSVVMRFRTDLKPGDTIVYRGQRLEILSARDLNARRAYLSCRCLEIEATG